MVKEYKGAYSGEHGDGLVRSEWIAPFFGPRLTAALGEIKSWLDPRGLMNPGKIVEPSRMDDKSLFRFKPGYATAAPCDGARLERMGRLRQGRRDVQQQRPLPQVRRRHHVSVVPRDAGRDAPDARPRQHAAPCAVRPTGSDGEQAVKDALDLCVSCKGCKRECPTGVDMARMKIEFLAHYKSQARPQRARSRHRLSAALRALGGAVGAAFECAGLRLLKICTWVSRRSASCRSGAATFFTGGGRRRTATWCCSSTPSTATSSRRTRAPRSRCSRPRAIACIAPRGLCCGRTFLSVGLVDEAKERGAQDARALAPYVAKGVPIVGLEPSCLFSLRDEFAVLLPGPRTLAKSAFLFEEFLAREAGQAEAQGDGAAGAAARPLPPEGLRRDAGGRESAAAGPGLKVSHGANQLLRHGGQLRLRGRALRRLDEDGGDLAAARDAEVLGGNPGRRRRHELPPPDRRRRRARGGARRARPRRAPSLSVDSMRAAQRRRRSSAGRAIAPCVRPSAR